MTSPYARAAWSWTEHLRRGGTTPWSTWVDLAHEVEPPAGWSPPGAAQLELLRTFAAQAGPEGASALPALAEVVLTRSGPGRGLAQQPLWWPGPLERPAFGAPPVDPVDVPVAELLRLGTGVLTELLLSRPTETQAAPRHGRKRSAFRLTGAPLTAAAVRRGLDDAGLVEGGRRSPRVLVFAEPLDRGLAQVWSARVQRGAAVRWTGFLDRWSGRPQLPPAVDVATLARRWAARVGPRRVHVVCGDPVSVTSRVLRVRLAPDGSELSPAAVDVVRRVNSVLNVRVGPDRRAALRQVLVSALLEAQVVGAPAAPLGVPARHQDWARTRARRLADDLAVGNYCVHGSPERLLPALEPGSGPTHPRRADTLGVVRAVCLAWAADRATEAG